MGLVVIVWWLPGAAKCWWNKGSRASAKGAGRFPTVIIVRSGVVSTASSVISKILLTAMP